MNVLKLFRLRRQDSKPVSRPAVKPRAIPDSSARRLPHVRSNADYYRRLDADPGFAAEMSERQRQIGQWPR